MVVINTILNRCHFTINKPYSVINWSHYKYEFKIICDNSTIKYIANEQFYSVKDHHCVSLFLL